MKDEMVFALAIWLTDMILPIDTSSTKDEREKHFKLFDDICEKIKSWPYFSKISIQ